MEKQVLPIKVYTVDWGCISLGRVFVWHVPGPGLDEQHKMGGRIQTVTLNLKRKNFIALIFFLCVLCFIFQDKSMG